GMEFNPDMMLQVIRNNIKFIEIPVRYLRRVGVSSATGDFKKTFVIGLGMLWLIFKHRLGFIKK
ncbi:glycosyltransferase family 2 protein, partial [Candidatus Pacearchaeota archaeon]|nr:glycosyltransferase family 2 protein [Candidatus Pacearchaeota archaeon]